MAHPIFCILIAFLFSVQIHEFAGYAGAQNVGVNYGRVADNLPLPPQVIDLYKSRNIQNIRIFDPQPDTLAALQNSAIPVIIGVVNNDLPTLAADATAWVQANIVPYAVNVNFRCISVGNEVIPGELAVHILPAMQSIQRAVAAANLLIPVSTAVSQAVLGTSYPPSAGAWSAEAGPIIEPIVKFLQENKYPLLCNVYPYFAYVSDPEHIRLDYALLSSTEVIVVDGDFKYTNLLDAQVDATYAALEKSGCNDVEIIVSETGWPSAGGDPAIASVINAQTYNNNVVARVKAGTGTPRRSGRVLQSYIFATFNENLKPAGIEQNFGLFNPDMTEVYHVNF
ncbi:putative glucan endo-1,3-beta-glucosidase GVI [Mercurialis annua]|uniref:putative glucan endo-1,3-beta-glucosidase GVI n=1 Tax=Mercurialis annua TaxID=3986 RepID=UPI0024AD59DA|nr:putative glucan endo-1,3-beta-glucosidase GVI [Mercurialis annua]